jgi:hypothetical protein
MKLGTHGIKKELKYGSKYITGTFKGITWLGRAKKWIASG